MNLSRIRRTVTHVHMVRASKPQEQVRVYFRRRPWIQQAMNIDFAHTAGSAVPIALR